jgi:hypothetical protein
MSQISQNIRGATILGFIPFLKLKYESVKSICAAVNKQEHVGKSAQFESTRGPKCKL